MRQKFSIDRGSAAMIRRSVYRTITILISLCCCGCGSRMDSSVQGTVTIDGVLADHGTVAFYPVGGGPPAYGNIVRDGSYSVRVGQGNLRDEDASRIHSGEYVVTVVVNTPAQNGETMGEAGPPKPGPRMTAEKYASKDASPLHKTVLPGPNVMPLELEGNSPAEENKATGSAPGDAGVTPTGGKPGDEHPEGAKP
jgi:hypothetical protein